MLVLSVTQTENVAEGECDFCVGQRDFRVTCLSDQPGCRTSQARGLT